MLIVIESTIATTVLSEEGLTLDVLVLATIERYVFHVAEMGVIDTINGK